tara:strand:- start:130 stop:363 length:234 start_codon:yes stop_codon:yes gene_type:complete
MQLHIDRVSEIAKGLLGLLADDGLVLSTEDFQRGFAHGMDGAIEPAPWYRRGRVNDNYMRGLRAGIGVRTAWTTERN